jgi:hypothetical protein
MILYFAMVTVDNFNDDYHNNSLVKKQASHRSINEF